MYRKQHKIRQKKKRLEKGQLLGKKITKDVNAWITNNLGI